MSNKLSRKEIKDSKFIYFNLSSKDLMTDTLLKRIKE